MIIKFDDKILETARSLFLLRGTIKHCAEKSGVNRTTIPRVIKAGTGEERVVNAISTFIKEHVA